MKFATQYDYSSHENPVVAFLPDDPLSRSLTNQSDKDSSDINIIMKRYEKTGLITDLLTGQRRQPVYGDFTGVGDFHQLQNTLAKTREAFNALPASTRTRFANDPGKLLDFLQDPENDAEAVELGLKDKSVLPVPEVPETPPAPAPGTGATPPAS